MRGFDVDPRLLRSFLVAAEELHFGRAADRLHIAQSALSERIRRLEVQVGVTLFERSTRQVALSAAGRELHRRASVAMPLLEEALERARAVGAGAGLELAAGIDAGCRDVVTPALSAAFAESGGRWSVHWHEAASAHLVAEVAAGRLGVAVVYSARAVDGALLRPFFDDDLVAVLPSDHAQGEPGPVSLCELAGLAVLVGGPGFEGHDQRCLALLRAAGLDPRTVQRPYGMTGVPSGHVAFTTRVLAGRRSGAAVVQPRQEVRFSFVVREHGPSPEVEAFVELSRAVGTARGWGRAERAARVTAA